MTLSACYGAPCATKLPDGGSDYGNRSCIGFDCDAALPDGGDKTKDAEWQRNCDLNTTDAGRDGGTDGGSDGGP